MVLHGVTPLVQAAAFTLGCVAIHNLRRYPDQVAYILMAIAIVLFLVLAVQLTPEKVLVDESDAEVGASISSAIQ